MLIRAIIGWVGGKKLNLLSNLRGRKINLYAGKESYFSVSVFGW